jgi:hypothetical protein
MEESKIILGWLVNTRSLVIKLPQDKHQKWTNDISTILSQPRVNKKQLESIIGRLKHTSTITPLLRHFLSRLHHALM